MKHLSFAIITFFNAAALLPMPSAAAMQLSLSSQLKDTEKLYDEITKTSGEFVWDFSNAETDADNPAVYTVYGDSLICEDIDGFMRWYHKKGGRTYFLKEENRLVYVAPSSEIISFGFCPYENMVGENSYAATGKYCRIYDIKEEGIYSSFAPILGKLVFSPTDTVKTRMTHERWSFNLQVYDETTDTINSNAAFRTDVYRWFSDAGKMPVAVFSHRSISGKSPDGMKEITSAYIADKDFLYGIKNSRNESSDVITSFTANYSHGIVNLQIEAEASTNVTIEIVSDGGIPYGAYTYSLEKGNNDLRLELNTGRPGRYVIALKTEDRTYKQYINCL